MADTKEETDRTSDAQEELGPAEEPFVLNIDWDEIEADRKDNQDKVRLYLGEFRADLEKAGLKEKTIGRHLSNAELYFEWMIEHEGYDADDAPSQLDGFLGDWFIRRCMWSTPNSVKTTAASLKKLLTSIMNHGHMVDSEYRNAMHTLRKDLPEWQRKCALYNDPYYEWDDIKDEFFPW